VSLPTSSTALRIIETAEKIFITSGFSRVSMDELARELGMSKKTLYAHFDSKDALLKAVLERRVTRVNAELEFVIASKRTFTEKLHDIFDLLRKRLGEVSPVFVDDLRRSAPECFAIIEKARGEMIPRQFGKLFAEGVASGDLRPDLDLPLLQRVLVTLVQTIVRPETMAELQCGPNVLMSRILNLFFVGILSEQGRRSISQVP